MYNYAGRIMDCCLLSSICAAACTAPESRCKNPSSEVKGSAQPTMISSARRKSPFSFAGLLWTSVLFLVTVTITMNLFATPSSRFLLGHVQAFQISLPSLCFARQRSLRMSSHNTQCAVHQSSSTTGSSLDPSSASSSTSTPPNSSPNGSSTQADALDAGDENEPVFKEATSLASSSRQTSIMEFPWNEHQRWALCDKVGQYIVQVVMNSNNDDTEGDINNNNNNRQVFILWRNLVQDTPELQGYPLQFLSERLRDEIQCNSQEEPVSAASPTRASPTRKLSPMLLQQQQGWDSASTCAIILPYLDQFRFEAHGGLSGLAFGVPGVADGTRLQTTPVGNVEVTIPQNYVRTGSILYELGQPCVEQWMPMNESSGGGKHWQRNGKELAAAMLVAQSRDAVPQTSSPDNLLDPEVINLAALTAVVLAGAGAVESLSHHLTLNIFWV